MTDLLTKIKTLIDDTWDDSNTASRTPYVTPIFDVKRINLSNQDVIFLKEIVRRPQDNASGGGSKMTETVVVVDFRTAFSRAQLDLMRIEIERIFNNNQKDVFSDGTFDINDIEDITDFSDETRLLYRKTVDVRLTQFHQTI